MRLLYVIDSLAPGGAETSLAAMAPGLVAHGIDLHVLSLGHASDLASDLISAGAVVHDRGGPAGRPGNLFAVIRTARRLRPDLIHTTLFEADVAGRAAAKLVNIPSSTSLVNVSYDLAHANEQRAWKFQAARFLDSTTAQFASRFHAVSGAVADTVAPALHVDRELMEVIPRGRAPERFPFQDASCRDSTRASLGLAPNTPMILAIGRLEPQKGLQHLLSAIPLIAEEVPNAVLMIAGRDGRSTLTLREQAANLQIEARFLGHRSDIPALLASADVLAFPSEREGSPGTLIEAMAVGTPIVASDIAPCLEVLGGRDTSVALLTRVGDPTSLGEAVVTVLQDSAAAQQRAVEGRARFERLYTVGAVSTRMADFFKRTATEALP